MITREQWNRKSSEQQWQYVEMLQRLYIGEEPEIEPDDTGAIATLNEIEPYDDGDYSYGRTWW